MKVFVLEKEIMTLTQFLKANDYISSGGEAKYFLSEYVVYVNNEQCLLRGKKLKSGDIVSIGIDQYILKYDWRN